MVKPKDEQKRVFISYAWTNDNHKAWVENLATKLLEYSIDVILDVWELKVGHDLYSFMERSISEVDKVLLLCNDDYSTKANSRKGGVGVESSIISDEVYNNTKQEKFIPVYIKDMNNNHSQPIYLKGRLGIMMESEDLSDEKIVEIVKAIFDQPAATKPDVQIKKNPFLNSEKKAIFKSNKADNKSIEEIINMVLNNPFENWTYFDEHGEFILKEDINLKIARAPFEEKEKFYEEWAIRHPDRSAYKYKYTIYYNNTRIDEFYLVYVDGLRQALPMPRINTNKIPISDYLKARAVNSCGRLEEYIERAGLVVEEY